MRYTDVDAKVKKYFVFLPFNPDEVWVQQVLVYGNAQTNYADRVTKLDYTPIDTENGISSTSTKHVHLIITGMGQMSQAMALQAAMIAHYPNFRDTDECPNRTHISFIAPNMREEMARFQAEYRSLFQLSISRYVNASDPGRLYNMRDGWHDPMSEVTSPYHYMGRNFLDIQWEFVDGSLMDASVCQYLEDAVADEDALCTFIHCDTEPGRAMAECMRLPESVLMHAGAIWFYQRGNASISQSLARNHRFSRIRPFGMLQDLYCQRLEVDTFGKVVNAWYNEVDIKKRNEVEFFWRGTLMADQWSSIHQAQIRFTYMRTMGIGNDPSDEQLRECVERFIGVLGVVEHNRWNVVQLIGGYRALTEQEVEECLKNNLKKSMKNPPLYAHLDICSMERLEVVDKDAIVYDERVVRAIPDMQNAAGGK